MKKSKFFYECDYYFLIKTFRIMRVTVFILLVSIFQTFASDAYSQKTRLSFEFSNKKLVDALYEIEEHTEFYFLYNDNLIDTDRRINLSVEGQTIDKVLDELFSGTDITYTVTDRKIILTPEHMTAPLQQQKSISGKVTDSSGAPLPGVTVVIKGTTQGTITDGDGDYSLPSVPHNATLAFSFVGMKTLEIPVAGKNTIDVTMTEETVGIEEVVAVGYGTQKRINLTGALATVEAEKLEGRPLTNVAQVLSGTASGVQVTQTSGQPGSDGTQIRIRGVGTLTAEGQNPLILIDGIASEGMKGLNPNDIESINVLKDAASSAIYGSRAANGVILITTKKGTRGKPKFGYHGYYGLQSPTRLMDLITDMGTHMELLNEAKTNLGRAPQFPQSEIDAYRSNNDPLLYPNTDWYDYFYGNPKPVQSHTLTARGGGENALYNLSLGYLGQDGLDGFTSLDRYNFRANNEIQLTEKLKVNSILSGYWDVVKGPSNISGVVTDWGSSPGIVVEGPDGKFGGPQVEGEGNAGNPLAVFSSQDRTWITQSFLGKLSVEYEILKGLSLQVNGGMKWDNSKNKTLNSPYILWDFRKDEVSKYSDATLITLYQNNEQSLLLTSYSILNFEKSFNDHNLKVMLGQSFESYKNEFFTASIKDLYSENTPVLNAGINEPSVSGTYGDWALLSYFGRLNYDYKSKYLFEANFRRDASSKFKKSNRWGMFPSFSVGWRVSEEAFFPETDLISNLKLRGSWGKLGNQNIGSNYPYQPVYNINQNYNIDGQVVDGAAQTALANEKIKWESTETTNAAVDLGLFSNHLNVSFDWFTRMTHDILVQVPIPITMGSKAAPYQNIAKVKNWGWELEASYQQKINDFSFNIGLNLSEVQNKVVKFKGETPAINGQFIIKEGLPYQSIYGYKVLGIFQTPDEVSDSPTQHASLTAPGDFKYEDFKEDGVINDEDRQIIGNTIPKYAFGMNLGFDYRNFDFGIFFQGILDVDRYLGGRNVYPFATNDRGLTPTRWMNRWTEENPSSELPRITINGDYGWNYRPSTFWMQDGSYLRLKNIQLGYSLPKMLCNKIGVGKLRVYVNAQNLFTWTRYQGYDPETLSTETNAGYPITKITSVGINLDF